MARGAGKRDRVRELLTSRGYAESAVAGGLERLVERWERAAAEIERGYAHGLDDYLNDVDGRETLQACLRVASADVRRALARRVRHADGRARSALAPGSTCLWGESNALRHGWNAGRNWWYFLRPRAPGPELARDLAAR